MTLMLRIALRNLFQNKIRLAIAVGGVALALMLILALDAVVGGMEAKLTAYIDYSGADIFVAQSGVRNMHMAASALPLSVKSQVRAVPGVATVTPVLYLTNVVVAGENRHLAYVIGLPAKVAAGRPWRIVMGKRQPGPQEAIIDRGVAEQSGIRLGDTVEILGADFTVSGLSEGTANLTNSVDFIRRADFAHVRGDAATASYMLITIVRGQSPDVVAQRIEALVDDVTAQTRQAFAAQERKVINDMSTDVMTIMHLVGVLIGMAVMALTVYTATLARRAEYGVLKALGARTRELCGVVLAQALISVSIGFLLGLGFTLVLAALIPYTGLNLFLQLRGAALLKVGAAAIMITAVSAILPITQIAGLDPAMVFRGKLK
jgi:putative ABC transport system permease protein